MHIANEPNTADLILEWRQRSFSTYDVGFVSLTGYFKNAVSRKVFRIFENGFRFIILQTFLYTKM